MSSSSLIKHTKTVLEIAFEKCIQKRVSKSLGKSYVGSAHSSTFTFSPYLTVSFSLSSLSHSLECTINTIFLRRVVVWCFTAHVHYHPCTHNPLPGTAIRCSGSIRYTYLPAAHYGCHERGSSASTRAELGSNVMSCLPIFFSLHNPSELFLSFNRAHSLYTEDRNNESAPPESRNPRSFFLVR